MANPLQTSFGPIAGKCFMVIGILIVLAATFLLVRTGLFVRSASKAPGQVVAISPGHRGIGHPVFTFADASGRIHSVHSSASTYSYQPGRPVSVLYDPKNPQHAEIDSHETLWSRSLDTFVFGVMFTGVIGFLLVGSSRVDLQACKLEYSIVSPK